MKIHHRPHLHLPEQLRRPESASPRLGTQTGFAAQSTFTPAQRPLVNLNGAPPVAQPGAPMSEADGYKKLIAADIKTAYGREATQADFDYWLPKMMGPNDSGFVTGGQMSATEYWHRRLLGWQAGGSDMATQGPYAGSPDANGPVPAATDVVPGVAPGHVATGGGDVGGVDLSSDIFMNDELTKAYKALINEDMKMAYGHEATPDDYNYWLPKLAGPNDSGLVTSGQMTSTEYWHRRMLGWQAEGTDQAISGPYAHSSDATGPVPSATDVLKALGDT